MTATMCFMPVTGIPIIHEGDNLAEVILRAAEANNISLVSGDVLVIAQKIVSKAEGRMVSLSSVTPSRQALDLAPVVLKDPRLIELILAESREVIRYKPGVLIVEHRLGFIMANAGIDHSNVAGDDRVLLLPKAPDQTAEEIRAYIAAARSVDVRVIINDSIGRAWRLGTVGQAIGVAGFLPIKDYIGKPDLFGRLMMVTQVAVADELAGAASFLMGQADEGVPVVVVKGARLTSGQGSHDDLIRPRDEDLFR